MKNFSTYNAVDVIDIILYKYNYYDNKIWTGIKNQINYMTVNEQSVLVSPAALKEYIEKTYPNELNKFKSIGSEFLHKDANSIYFLNLLLSQMQQLKWVKLTLDKSKNYSRLINDGGQSPRINFSYKILHITLRLFDLFQEDELEDINKILTGLKLLRNGKPYERHRLDHFVSMLDRWMNNADLNPHDHTPDEQVELVAMILDIIEAKLEGDNPEVLLVTDY
jgi:hypothetical protein